MSIGQEQPSRLLSLRREEVKYVICDGESDLASILAHVFRESHGGKSGSLFEGENKIIRRAKERTDEQLMCGRREGGLVDC